MAEIYKNNQKSVAEVLREMKSEALAFLHTRYELLAAEVREKAGTVKKSVPMFAVAAALTMATFATFTFFLVSLLANLIGSLYHAATMTQWIWAWSFAFLIVCVVYGCAAGILFSSAIDHLKMQSLLPKRTMRVLQQDRDWVERESRGIRQETRAA